MRRMHFKVNSIHMIGKEANGLDKVEALGLGEESYIEYLPPVNADNKVPLDG